VIVRATLAAILLLADRPGVRRRLGAPAVAAVVWLPLGLVAAAALPTVALLGRRRRAASSTRRARRDVVVLGELTTLGIGAGLGFGAAIGLAAEDVDPALAAEVRHVSRRATIGGGASEYEAAEGLAGQLYRAAGRASVTGAPILATLAALVAELRSEERARAVASARKLPVRLLFPLALLILPGFLVLTVGPTVLSAIDRLAL
jgi:tight adherence protein C